MQQNILEMASETNPITETHSHLIDLTRDFANSIWEVQQMKRHDSEVIEILSQNLVESVDKLEELVKSIPDYEAIVGTEEEYKQRHQALKDRELEAMKRLEKAMEEGEKKLKEIEEIEEKFILTQHDSVSIS